MQNVCPVCYDDSRPCDMTLPGCEHAIHSTCMISLSQYDVRCPICRVVPEGVQEREQESSSTVVYVTSVGDEPAGGGQRILWTLNEEEEEQEREIWTRYRTRRRRCLNQNPRILAAFNQLRDVRREIRSERMSAEARYKTLCRDAWRNDEVIRGHMKVVDRLRRKERRLERTVHGELRERIGSEPR